ncbi:helix-turn-helix domain-containing protein [Mucilaginibacter sp. Bleaf8]|uniref:helix-turn-helix domain-containing protein n=1 Tax=Mucilaginibacter sp. Bleaf8 TaxID=2834430 RepID=UPI001BD0F02C|nr:helix-turn-helix domain-containing protein [Mucilaginibacter sp. Bleaf8]MBS7566957.1 helix-turn-helix domain-containing protein [Mucilaginibacter sp. Bleaf8]
MERQNLHEPFSIKYTTLDEGPGNGHKHSFFELVYIVEGTGIQCINQSQFAYHPGHMFLITPDDCHSFDVKTTTTFFFLRFNDIYIRESGILTSNIQKLEFILQNANHKPGCILKNLVDKQVVKPLIDAIIREYENRDIYNQELIHQYVNTLIVLVARNIAKFLHLELSENTDQRAVNILNFIQANIYHPEKLRAEYLCNHFNVSVNYLGKYFKQHTGSTLQRYITQYRQTLIEHRLIHSDKRLGEIVDEFGFTDESHLNKFFRNNKGVSPKAFRLNNSVKVSASVN